MKHIHFVGIGGIGMSGLAEVVHAQGFSVSGSDLVASENTAALSARGIRIDLGHAAEHVRGADLVVYSSAVNPDTNPETLQARQLGIPIIRRAELLAHVTRLGKSLAIAGTHGKTTTTSLCGLVLIAGDTILPSSSVAACMISAVRMHGSAAASGSWSKLMSTTAPFCS